MSSTARKQHSGQTTVLTKQNVEVLYQSDKLSLHEHSLRCTHGPYAGKSYVLNKAILLIGRGDWCDVSLPQDDQISRMHCELQLTSSGIQIQDLESSNGCFLDEVRVYSAPFEVQRTLRVGRSQFQLVRDTNSHEITIHFYDRSGLLVGKNAKMRKVFSMLESVAGTDAPVFLGGETGTGKSSVARALHEQSPRRQEAFVTVNCGALSPSLIESSLFGHEAGAFTGADSQHQGYFEQAHGGTLFLDEIAELPLTLQPKLLDVLERKKVRRLGSNHEIDVDFRLVTASHRDLHQALHAGSFREDLYYRLAVIELQIPALRERIHDIPLLCQFILAKLMAEPPKLTDTALRKLQSYYWPGNVRQLHNILQRAIVFHKHGPLDAAQIVMPTGQQDSPPAQEEAPDEHAEERALPDLDLRQQLSLEEQRILQRTLKALKWDVTKSAGYLGISRSSLYSRLTKFGIKRLEDDQ